MSSKLRKQSAAESAASFLERRQKRRERMASAPRVGDKSPPIPNFRSLRLPAELFDELADHCRSFGIAPKTWVRRMLDQSKLSRGGT